MFPMNNYIGTGSSTDYKTLMIAMIYILSGICQPLLMMVCKHAGLANPTAQLYMLFYYLGPTLVLVFHTFRRIGRRCRRNGNTSRDATKLPLQQQQQQQQQQNEYENGGNYGNSVSTIVIIKASLIALFDIAAQSFNFTGASYAGATIFAVIYSSVTIWTALFSRCVLHRSMTYRQWCAVLLVVVGLCISSVHSMSLGADVVHGTIYILIGSCMHGATYVLSEAIMVTSHHHAHHDVPTTSSCPTDHHPQPKPQQRELLTYMENSSIQGVVACIGLLIWQIIYTIPQWDEAIRQPTQLAGTTVFRAMMILFTFAAANLFHSLSFYYTVAHFPGGSTSAGVMKGLQAVLVFVAAHVFFCQTTKTNTDDTTMCFTTSKLISLITVVSGVVLFRVGGSHFESSTAITSISSKAGYTPIQTT